MGEDIKSPPVSRRGLLTGASALLASWPALGHASARPEGLPSTLQARALRISMPGFSAPPFFEGEGANVHGFDADLAYGIAEALGVEAQFDRTSGTFDEAVDRVAQGDADIAVCKLSRTLRRGRVIRYARPYVRLFHGLITNRVRFAHLAGRRETEEVVRGFDGVLGVIASSSFATFAASSFPRARLRAFGDWSEIVAAIRNEEIDAAYRDDFEIKRLMLEDPSLTVVAQSITLTDRTDTLAIGVRPDAGHLLDFVNLYFDLSDLSLPLSADDILKRFGHGGAESP